MEKALEFSRTFGIDQALAQYYLELSNGDVERAASLYLDSGLEDTQPYHPSQAPTQQPLPIPISAPAIPQPISNRPPQQPRGVTGFPSGYDSDEGLDSGLDQGGDLVDGLFKSAQKRGAVAKHEMPAEEKEKFAGVGYTLGNSVDNTRVVPNVPKQQSSKKVILTFWKDCFTVDNGPPRKLDDPGNRPFLEDINRGVVPRELTSNTTPGTQFNIELIKKNEDYTPPPKPKVVPFAGAGHSLNAPSSASYTPKKIVGREIKVDESQPTTSIQVRCQDGTRLQVKCNLTHTIGDLRAHLQNTFATTKEYQLMTTFPNKVLTDNNSTIQQEGLTNASIMMRVL